MKHGTIWKNFIKRSIRPLFIDLVRETEKMSYKSIILENHFFLESPIAESH